jgi:hypothetical protein
MLNKKALAASVSAPPAEFVEDVFSTYLYTGTGAALTITNDIDLDGEGGLTWIKSRSAATNNQLFDTVRGATNELISNSTAAQAADADTLTAFNADGFSLGADSNVNTSAATYCSWSFRKAPKFFDVVTYTGTATARTIAHNLGSEPGMILVKCTSASEFWVVYHRSLGNTKYLILNNTSEEGTFAVWNNTSPTSTQFSVGTDGSVNGDGKTYVAYLFAHDAGEFGTAGTDNVISCGSYTGNGSATGTSVTLGYEPQWLLIKRTDSTGDWNLIDNMRGFVVGGTDAELNANLTSAESTGTFVTPTATGFQLNTTDAGYNASSATYIYMAIRRPMKVPTTGTSVFSPVAYAGAGAGTTITTGFPVDMTIVKNRGTTNAPEVLSRLTGSNAYLFTSSTAAEGDFLSYKVDNNTGVVFPSNDGNNSSSGSNFIAWNFSRRPQFFDQVCYTGTGSARTIAHNLGVAPELMIVKRRDGTTSWITYSASLGNNKWLLLNGDNGQLDSADMWNSTTPTPSVFTVGAASTNIDSATHVAYLFASVAGVSKVGSYTGTGGTQTIACGFTGGARFVLIKRTDSTGNWFVWDTARGIVSGNDPYLLLNSTDAEVTNTDYIDPVSSGFEISSTAPAAINASGGTFIFLAIA